MESHRNIFFNKPNERRKKMAEFKGSQTEKNLLTAFAGVASVFRAVSVAEKQPEKRYLDLAANIDANKVFQRETPEAWRCRHCGCLHEGNSAPDLCPACAHPRLTLNYWEKTGRLDKRFLAVQRFRVQRFVIDANPNF
jgi:rubrerythrin